MTRSDTFVAMVKNTFKQSKVVIYKIEDLENESLDPDLIEVKSIDWPCKDKECVHINYLYVNQKWYLLAGFVGSMEIYNEDGTKRYF